MEQNLNLYQVFYEVAGCRNFSAAARKLYISQPAVSKSISKLESYLQTLLFERSSKGVVLTPEGELLYRHVEKAMQSLLSGEEQLKTTAALGISRLSIGVSTTLCKYVLLPLLKTFIAENPHIKITISCQSTYETLSALQNGSIDIGLVGIPENSLEGKHTVTYLPLKTIEDIFVASDSYLHPFYERFSGELYEHEDFFHDASFIMLNRENISRKHADAFLYSHHVEFHNIIEVNNMDLSIEFARAGLGIACVIRDFVKKDMEKGILQELKLEHRIPKRQIGFAYPSKSPVSEAMTALISYCRSFLTDSYNDYSLSNKGVEK